MRTVLKNISLLGALIVIVYLVSQHAGLVKNTLFSLFNIPGGTVMGASTMRAQEISDKFKSDIGEQLITFQNQALSFTLGDAITTIARLQKIPQDFQSIKTYTEGKIYSFMSKERR